MIVWNFPPNNLYYLYFIPNSAKIGFKNVKWCNKTCFLSSQQHTNSIERSGKDFTTPPCGVPSQRQVRSDGTFTACLQKNRSFVCFLQLEAPRPECLDARKKRIQENGPACRGGGRAGNDVVCDPNKSGVQLGLLANISKSEWETLSPRTNPVILLQVIMWRKCKILKSDGACQLVTS